jgi:hypothetical protein
MSGAPAEIDIIANDEASDIFQEVSGNFSEMSSNVSEASDSMSSGVSDSMQQTASSVSTMTTTVQADNSQMQDSFNQAGSTAQVSMNQITTSTGEASDATDASSQSFSQNAMQMNSAAMSGAMLYMAVNNIENAQTSLSRANLMEEKAANSVTLAQQAYNLAVAKYGENSIQALDASNKLNLAIETQQVDQERVAEANRNYNSTLMMSALTVIPAVINVISLASHATQIWEGAQAALDVVMDANPIGLVVIAIAALVAGIIAAYTYCKPFRDVINDIGSIIGGTVLSAFNALKSAGDALWNGLSWAYNNILLPVANFFKEIFVADLNVAMIPIKAFESAIGAVANAVKPLSDLIGGLGSALSHLCFAHAAPAAEEFNKQVTQSISLSDQLTHKTNTLGSSLQGLAGNVSVKGGGGTSNVTIGSPNIQIGNITGSASLKQTRDAVNKGICDAMYKKGIMNKVT